MQSWALVAILHFWYNGKCYFWRFQGAELGAGGTGGDPERHEEGGEQGQLQDGPGCQQLEVAGGRETAGVGQINSIIIFVYIINTIIIIIIIVINNFYCYILVIIQSWAFGVCGSALQFKSFFQANLIIKLCYFWASPINPSILQGHFWPPN